MKPRNHYFLNCEQIIHHIIPIRCMMSRLLIISPHLDDAVLSCGARIAKTVESGGEVVVATCFTTPWEAAPEELQQLYDRRKADDGDALKMLGAGIRHLGFTDAPFRNPQYYNFNTILF